MAIGAVSATSQESAHVFEGHLTVIDEPDCLLLVAGQTIGRVAWADQDEVTVVPVTYSSDGAGRVTFRTAVDTVLARLPGRNVSFQVDEFDRETRTGWSVLLRGTVELAAASPDLSEPWAPGHADLVLSIVPHAVSGRAVAAPES